LRPDIIEILPAVPSDDPTDITISPALPLREIPVEIDTDPPVEYPSPPTNETDPPNTSPVPPFTKIEPPEFTEFPAFRKILPALDPEVPVVNITLPESENNVEPVDIKIVPTVEDFIEDLLLPVIMATFPVLSASPVYNQIFPDRSAPAAVKMSILPEDCPDPL